MVYTWIALSWLPRTILVGLPRYPRLLNLAEVQIWGLFIVIPQTRRRHSNSIMSAYQWVIATNIREIIRHYGSRNDWNSNPTFQGKCHIPHPSVTKKCITIDALRLLFLVNFGTFGPEIFKGPWLLVSPLFHQICKQAWPTHNFRNPRKFLPFSWWWKSRIRRTSIF